MNSNSDLTYPDETSFEEAAEWVARIESGRFNNASQAALQNWLQADPRRTVAFARMQNILDRTAGHELVAESSQVSRRKPRTLNLWTRFWIPVTASIATAALAALLIFPLTSMAINTAPGEIRVVKLGDGSTITLRGNSTLRVDFGFTRRVIDVSAGEAAFDVAHHLFKPFVVRSENFQVVAVGTVFDVSVTEVGSTVTLIEGEVDVTDAAPVVSDMSCSPRNIRLLPGQQVAYRHDGARSAVQRADLVQVTAWQDNRIELQSRPLQELVDELNRTFYRDIQVIDPELAKVTVNISLKVDDFDLTLDRLEKQLPIAFDRQAGKQIVVHSRTPNR